MANQENNEEVPTEEVPTINLAHLNKDGLLAHIFDMCMKECDKGVVQFHQNATQADKLRLICIYVQNMKNELVHQVKTMQECWIKSLDEIKQLNFMHEEPDENTSKIQTHCIRWIDELNNDEVPLSKE